MSISLKEEEEEGRVAGWQHSFVQPRPPRSPPEDAEPTERDPSETASLSRSRLQRLPRSVLNNRRLKYLYLEGNQMGSLPDCLFPGLPRLLWLDLRNNQIARLPAEIGSHRLLKTLLLEGNPIAELPPELGNVISLRGLSLRNCPVTFPPQDVVREGLQCILRYLRAALAQRPLSARKPPPELPEVEKLQLSELPGSTAQDRGGQSEDEDEVRRFRALKEEESLLEKAEPDSMGARDRRPPLTKKKKVATKAGIIPKLGLCDTRQRRRGDGGRQPLTQEMKEREAVVQQRRKSEEALREWRSQAKILQEKKTLEQQRRQAQTREEAEFNSEPGVKDSCNGPQKQTSITQRESGRSARELERLIRAHVEKMQERRRNPRGSASEQVAAAHQDVQEMRRLQAQLLEGRRERQKCFAIYTGDTWQSFLEK